jgi:hypothetical protein
MLLANNRLTERLASAQGRRRRRLVSELPVSALQSPAKESVLRQQVTLVVYGWHSVEPGTLAWVFPSLRAALKAVVAMRNAVRWAIVTGKNVVATTANAPAHWLETLEELRARGAVLIEGR